MLRASFLKSVGKKVCVLGVAGYGYAFASVLVYLDFFMKSYNPYELTGSRCRDAFIDALEKPYHNLLPFTFGCKFIAARDGIHLMRYVREKEMMRGSAPVLRKQAIEPVFVG